MSLAHATRPVLNDLAGHSSLRVGVARLPEEAMSTVARHGRRMAVAAGSAAKHHAWSGGYLDHLDECFAYAARFYAAVSDDRPQVFSLDDALLVLWLHDIAKVFRYTTPGEREDREYDREARALTSWDFALSYATDAGIALTAQQRNALRYVHGELNGDPEGHHPTERRMGELATLCHMADIWSARGAHDQPRAGVPLPVHPLLADGQPLT